MTKKEIAKKFNVPSLLIGKHSSEHRCIPLLLNHDVSELIGNVYCDVDKVGKLLLENNFHVDIGFQVLKEKVIDGIRRIDKIKLLEISLMKVKND